MYSIDSVAKLLTDYTNKSWKVSETILNWRKVYYTISLHTSGACPAFKDLRRNTMVFPLGYFGEPYQQIFDIQHFAQHPRESENIREYRKSMYKPFTKDPFLRCISTVIGSISQDSNYTIECDNKADNDYIWGANFDGKSLPEYLFSHFKTICEDANGFFVVMPKEASYEMTTKDVQTQVRFVHSHCLIFLSADEIIFYDDEYFWLVNGVGYFRFAKNADGTIYHVDEAQGGYYAHLIGNYPIVLSGGIWNTQGYYDSWLDAGRAYADEYISGKSAEQLVFKEGTYPVIQIANQDCPDCVSMDGKSIGKIRIDDATSDTGKRIVTCPRCMGSCKVMPTPGQVMTAPIEDMTSDLIKFINPDTSIAQLHVDNNKNIYDGIMKALNLYVIDEAQSGVAKDRDLEVRYQFYSQISNDLFGRVLPQLITYILALRNVSTIDGTVQVQPPKFTIIKPSQFHILTPTELLTEYDTSVKSQVPTFVRAKQLEDYIDRKFGADPLMIKKVKVINQLDFMSTASEAEKTSMVIGGAASSRERQFSSRLPTIIDGLIREKGKDWFVNSTIDVIKVEVDTVFALILPVPEVVPTVEKPTPPKQ